MQGLILFPVSTAFARRLVLAVHFRCALASLARQATFAAESISLKSEKGTLVLTTLINDKVIPHSVPKGRRF